MKIEQYISQLLYRHQCVTVPGFGAFLTEIQSAQLHENSHSFYPPKKLVSFNSHLKNNDGLLANHIAQFEKISYEDAVSSIKREVFSWKRFLLEDQNVTLKNLGEFSLNADKNLVFIPSENTNYLMDSFGLNSFISPFIRREILNSEVVFEAEETPIQFIAEERRSRPYLKYAAILVLALPVTGSIGYKFYENKIAEETLIVETAVQQQVQNKIQEATFFIENPISSVTLTVKEQKLAYHVVAGAFRDEANAQKAYLQLTQQGFKARRIAPNKHGLYPVLYGSYPTLREAELVKKEINLASNPDAWLLVKEL